MKREDRLIYLMTISFHRLSEYLKMRFEGASLGITPVQAGILFLLRDSEGLSMTGLSVPFHVDKSAVTGMVDRLEREGFVSRGAHPSDRRVKLIRITEKGKRQIDRAKPIILETNGMIMKGFTEGEIEAFSRVLLGFFDKFQLDKNGGAGK